MSKQVNILGLRPALALTKHIIAMADDDYLTGHPEWIAIVEEAKSTRKYLLITKEEESECLNKN